LPLFYLNTISFFNYTISVIDLICLFILLGAMGKSAQIFLHVWLPDAMEGPTPVSALIHAATMVTAGVYLIIRSSHLFEYSPAVSAFITFIGIFTSLVAASIGIVQNDLKKVIAYSTCSQLGYMVCACGLSAYNLSFFHLFTHAFFKALLFLSAGSVIHATSDEQDMRKMGGLQPFLPITYAVILIGSFSLAGFPFMAGFYSKEAILESSYATYSLWGHFSFYLGSFVAFLTAFYSFRLVYLTFLAKPNGFKNLYKHIHEADSYILITLTILALCAIIIGYLFSDLLVGLGTFF
jgi:proton-translocating NADH-quinone oxidoreductase chain L